jgi:uncharacterized LabA/DUF88 family protein
MRTPQVDTWGLFLYEQVLRTRVISLIDGFNLYHAIHRLHESPLKWLDLRSLSAEFVHPDREELVQVLYFTTLATHREQSAQLRQKTYLRALELRGISPILGQFKEKDRECSRCFSRYTGHEEKETDVNIALALLDLAYQDKYDRAILVTNDSDQAPSIRKVLERFPNKKVTILIPPQTRDCNELIQVASNKAKITADHLRKCLLPEIVFDASGSVSIRRPKEYGTALVPVLY